MNDIKMIMLVGLPASGKSYKARELSQEYDAEIFSSDALREELFGDVNHQDNNHELFNELHRRIKDCFKSGKSAIYDACNISYKRRMAFLQEIKNIPCEKICVLMATPYEECLKRNMERERKVPEEVIKRMYMNFQCPHNFEGWDDIKVIHKDFVNKPQFNKSAFESMARYNMKNFNQNNPHHLYNVFDHSKALMLQYPIGDIRRIAAILHDCMKKKAETVDGDGISHFYRHENMSAYYVLTHPKIVNCCDYKTMLDIIFYITYHMLAHNITHQKTINKYKLIFGNTLYTSLIDFANKDTLASKSVIFNNKKQNIYIVCGNYSVGYTRLGDMFIVDTEDVEKLLNYTWCIKNRQQGDDRLVSMTDGKMIFMHRLIMNIDDIKIAVDHINHIQNDNRKKNLRLCSFMENSMNTSLSKNNTSGVNGVSQMKNGRYRAYINYNYKQIHLGCYDTLEEATEVRRQASAQYYGEFANLKI